ncbi:MAG: DUF512 domain-containing protein [Acidobacteria bacterium]|nr:DUF512 domain-containing protein [Acidobacteriota bacterium]MCB9397026.1 DUF512 domain-containing protein [Acidobacteriota bacterium]
MAEKVATTHRRKGGVVVKEVVPESLADQCGLEPGDRIVSINDFIIPDSLSFFFNIAMPDLRLAVEKHNGEAWDLEIENDFDAPFGVALEDDPIMLCRNKCIFCFVDQNPKGYRKTLLIKDEDIRLSFMYGNYSTLSSTDAAEEARIIREKISPLYVSVHATDPETRIFMLKGKNAGNILERLRHFAENDISFHAQIVLCPGINDGAILDRTVQDLAGLFPHCLSIAVVPLGITEHRQKLIDLTPVSDQYCADIVQWSKVVRREMKRTLGYPLVFLGDEFYLRAGKKLPSKRQYRDFPQMENGIGMVRRFIDQFKRLLPKRPLPAGLKATLITGTLFGPALEELITELNQKWNTHLQVAAIRNDSFGPTTINVAGLVHAQDTIDQLRNRDLGAFLVVPRVMVKDPDDPIMIDDYYPHQLGRALGLPVVLSGNEACDLLDTLRDWQANLVPEFPERRSA